MKDAAWAEALAAAITVIDKDGIIQDMNALARVTFAADGGAALIGKSIYDCHPEAAQLQIREMLRTGVPNHYTIQKNGQRKIIHQLPWYRGGELAGLLELSVPLPEAMPHFDRG